jgi:hypothetical protein
MKNPESGMAIRRAMAVVLAPLVALSMCFAQAPAGPPAGPPNAPNAQQGAPLLAPDQLDNLVAPIALYPDPLLSQVLAASTYPLEVAEAEQWLQHNGNLQGAQLMNAAKQQNWDPSVQALVAFPQALGMLANDVRWTTDLGNAFLAQQADVMSAIQTMRARAQANGRLATTPQQVVTTETQGDESAIQIQPAQPNVIYVPQYSPAYVWGQPAWDWYPDVWYPPAWGFGFYPGIYMGAFFPGWGGWGGWGWGCGWFGGGLFVNIGFFGHWGFHGGFWGGHGWGGSFAGGGRAAWAHDPGHRMGVPYPNRAVAGQFHSDRFVGSARAGGSFSRGAMAGGARSAGAGGWQRFGSAPAAGRSEARGFASTGNRGYAGPAQNSRGYGSAQGFRSAPSYSRSVSPGYSAPRASYAAPRYSAPSRSFSAPRSFASPHYSSGGGGHYSGGGGHSGGGGGHSGGGGGGGHHR